MARKVNSRRHKKGGSNYSSAASYGSYVNGTENQQYDRTLSTSGPYANIPGNVIIGAQGQNSVQPNLPTSQSMALIQSAGKRSRGKRGGLWGQVINQAVVPFTLLGLQQTYRKKRHGGKKTRKVRGGRRSRRYH